MDKLEQEMKLKLLEQLMEEMDEAVASKIKPKKEEPSVLVKEVKQEEMPISDAKDMIKEKLMMPEAEMMEEEEKPMMPEMEDMEEDEDEEDSRVMSKLRELKEKRMKG